MNAHLSSALTPALAANKRLVADYYARVWNARNAAALQDFVADDYVQHNPAVPNGRAPLQSFLEGLFVNLPEAEFSVARLVAEGDLVIAHCLFRAHPADAGTAVVDLYRVAEGRLVEHWDVKEAVPAQSANGNPMV
ncbi:nuclear transport factor 2 family protein [Niveibacterium sp. SC-1]|uniref:nuclear transport factor 2 family protein n=1 Tax=Niveibacterium sp. SC-1 TaxID=3135646 RepID=UPI00311E75A8